MLAAPRRYGRVSYQLAPRYADVLREVAAGNPVIVLQDVGLMFPQWHYAVLNGFDYPSGTIYLRSGTKPRKKMPFTAFERDWMKSGYWAMVVTPPDRIPVTATEQGWMSAVLAMARRGTRERPPGLRRRAQALARQSAGRRRPGQPISRARRLCGAVAVLRVARRNHPQSVIVLNNLAQALSDRGT